MTRIQIHIARHPFDAKRTVYVAYQVYDNGRLFPLRMAEPELPRLMERLDADAFGTANARPCWQR